MRIEANADWCEAQRSDPILAKVIAAKEEDKRPTGKEIIARLGIVWNWYTGAYTDIGEALMARLHPTY